MFRSSDSTNSRGSFLSRYQSIVRVFLALLNFDSIILAHYSPYSLVVFRIWCLGWNLTVIARMVLS
jgi:hypothetical protein